MNIIVDNDDLNAIDNLNGNSSISSKGPVFNISNGDILKGALDKYNKGFSKYTELQFILGMKSMIYEYQVERFEYENFPDGLDKYRLETKIVNNGSVLVTKFLNKFYAVNYTTENFNMYEEPMTVIVNEPKSLLNGKKIDLNDNGVIIRNNHDKRVLYMNCFRFLKQMEKILYQIEKNLFSSAPKGIVNLKGSELSFADDNDNPERDSYEKMINGENTFYVIKSKDIGSTNLGDDNGDNMFIPIELTDRTDSLIKNYTFLKEQLKEMIGSESNTDVNKKERLITDEVKGQQNLATSILQHAFNIRKVDIERLNSFYGTNLTIELQSDERDEEVDDVLPLQP